MAAQSFWVFYDTYAKIQSNFMSTDDTQASILKMRPEDVKRYLIWTEGWENWQPLKTYLESDQKNFVSTFNVSSPKNHEKTAQDILKEVLEKTQTQTSFKPKNIHNEETDTKSYSSINLNEETISRIVRQEQEQKAGITANEKNFDADDLTWSNNEKSNLDFSSIVKKTMTKRAIRHELKIEVLLISAKGKTFRSCSKNISLSGSLLEDKIPFDYYDSKFDVVIINNRTNDPAKARVKLSANIAGNKGDVSQRIYYLNVTDQQKKALQLLLEDYLRYQKKD